jgi:hypothetical protein
VGRACRHLSSFRSSISGIHYFLLTEIHAISQLPSIPRRERDDCYSLPCPSDRCGLKFGSERLVDRPRLVCACGPVFGLGNRRTCFRFCELRLRSWGTRFWGAGPFAVGSPVVAGSPMSSIRVRLRPRRGRLSRPRIDSIVFERVRHPREPGNRKRLNQPYSRNVIRLLSRQTLGKAELPLT